MQIRSLIAPAGAAIVTAVVALGLASHGRGASVAPSATTVASGRAAVVIKNYAFVPQVLTVRVGTRVTWSDRDATAHTATMDQGTLDTGTINPGQSRTIAFAHPGTYPYHCAFHAFMTGTIKVIG